MATFKTRKNGWEQAVVRKRGYPAQSKTFPTKTAAKKWAKAVETAMDQGVFVSISDAETTTLRDLISRFKTEYAPHHYRKRDDEKEAWRFQCDRLDEVLGPYSLAAINQKLVAQYRDDRIAGSDSRKPVGESTTRKEIYLLSKLLRFAEAECGIALPRGNPVDKIRKPSDGKSRNRRLTAAEWATLAVECQKSRNPYLWPAVQVSLETAMRQGELLGLRWEDIDRVKKSAYLHETKNGEFRAAPLTSKALSVLDALPRSIDGVVLPVERMTLYHAFMYACKRAKIKNFTWHDLRHEAMSRLAESGQFSMLEMSEISGHKTLQMLKRYTHLHASDLATKMDTLRPSVD